MATNSGFVTKESEQQTIQKWIDTLANLQQNAVGVVSSRQGWGKLGLSQSILQKPLCLAGQTYDWGLGTHADSEIIIRSAQPLQSFRALVGVDHNKDSINSGTEVVFSIWVGDQKLTQSQILKVSQDPELLEVPLNGATHFILKAQAVGTIQLAHADWAQAEVITADGQSIHLGTPETACFSQSMPVSFTYNGIHSEQWFRQYGIDHNQTKHPDHIAHTFTCHDTQTGLQFQMHMQQYHEFPACFWHITFSNTGKTATPILENVQTLSLQWPTHDKKILYRSRGSFHYTTEDYDGEAFRDSFMLVKNDLSIGQPITFGAVDGRPSVDWMPYFNFQGDNEGLVFGIGWTGQWQTTVTPHNNSIAFEAGMQYLHTQLLPGETITQPSTLMIYWQSDNPIRAHNLLRRFIKEKLAPRVDDQPISPPVCNLTWGGMVASEHLKRIANIKKKKLSFDYYWIDAGWYGTAGPNADEFTPHWGSQAGNWTINRDTFPDGFKPISDAAHDAGMKFLLWFEPERAVQGTPITREHPEWFLAEDDKRNSGSFLLLNLGHTQARQWCTELIADMIAQQGIDCYRQDFNFSPLPYWRRNDTPDRVGISEIRHVEGLYTFLDELRRRFPNLLIDNCASGGRRLDFEMMRRSIPLWASDMQCFPSYLTERNFQHVQGLSMWLPQFSFGTQDHPDDTYHFRSTMAAGINCQCFMYEYRPVSDDYPYPWLKKCLDQYHRAKVFYTGDFYPLLDQRDSFRDWAGYQFHRPDLYSGIILAFRKSDSPIIKVALELHDLPADTTIEIENADTGDITRINSDQLMTSGLIVEMPNKRDSRLFFYRYAQ